MNDFNDNNHHLWNYTAILNETMAFESFESIQAESGFIVFLRIISLLICAIGLVANLMVILVVILHREAQDINGVEAFNLSLLNIIWLISQSMSSVNLFKVNAFACHLFMALTYLAADGIPYQVIIICANHSYALCLPRSSHRILTMPYVLITCLLAWIVSIVFYGYIYGHVTFDDEFCMLTYNEYEIIGRLTEAFLFFIVPLLFILICSTVIIVRSLLVKQVQPSTLMVLTLAVVFIVAWLPNWSLQIYIVFRAHRVSYETLVTLLHCSMLFPALASTFNPIIYLIFNINLRTGFNIIILRQKLPVRRYTNETSTTLLESTNSLPIGQETSMQ